MELQQPSRLAMETPMKLRKPLKLPEKSLVIIMGYQCYEPWTAENADGYFLMKQIAFCLLTSSHVVSLQDASLFTDIQWVICDVLFIAPPLLCKYFSLQYSVAPLLRTRWDPLIQFFIGSEKEWFLFIAMTMFQRLVLLLWFAVGSTLPADTLAKTRPQRNLISFVPIFSMFSFNTFILCGYIFLWYYIETLPG